MTDKTRLRQNLTRSGACHCAGVCWSSRDGQQGIPRRLWVFRWNPRIVAEYQSRHRCNVGSGFGDDGWPSRRSPGHEAVLGPSTVFTRTEGLRSRHVFGDVAGSPVRQTDGKKPFGRKQTRSAESFCRTVGQPLTPWPSDCGKAALCPAANYKC